MITVPSLVSKYINVQNDEVHFHDNNDPEGMAQGFSLLGKNLRKKLKKLHIANLTQKDIEKYVEEYAIYLTGHSFVLLHSNQSESKSGNKGDNRQHWIPECYMKAFAQQDELQKRLFTIKKVHRREKTIWEKRLSQEGDYFTTSLIKLDDIDFKEPKGKSKLNNFYDPQFELLLSVVETDYGTIRPKPSSRPSNLWEFVVLSVFFMLMVLRTKEYRDAQPSDMQLKLRNLTGTVVRFFPKQIANLDVRILDRRIALPLYKQGIPPRKEYPLNSLAYYNDREARATRLPFNQKPYFYYIEKDNGLFNEISLWAIYSPDSVIWLRHKETSYTPSKDSLHNIITHILESNDCRDSYFHPDHDHWDNLIFNDYEFIKTILTKPENIRAISKYSDRKID